MLKIENVFKSYDTNEVLRGADFSVPEGSIFGLIGPNGAGKTTLLNIVAGILPMDSGRILINDEPVRGTLGNAIGYLPDLPSFFEYLTCKEYLDFLGMGQNLKRTRELLLLVSLKPEARIRRLSRGMRQRLGIAAALVNNPQILLLDEPTSALDPIGRNDVMKILQDLRKEGRSIIFSTHILNDMEQICDNYGFLKDGKIILKNEIELEKRCAMRVHFEKHLDDGELENLERLTEAGIERVNERVILINAKGDILSFQEKVFKALVSLGLTVKSVSNETLTLDSLFKEVCGR